MELDPLAQNLKDHLKKFRPKQYKSLKASGKLDRHCQVVAEEADQMFQRLRQQGMSPQEAEEWVEELLYPQAEDEKELSRQESAT